MNYNVLERQRHDAAESRTDGYIAVLFFIWPFVGALCSFLRLNRKVSLYIIYGFCLVFGWTFNPINELLDSFRYALDFNVFRINPQLNFNQAISDFLKGENKDIYTTTCYYLVDKGGGDVHLLFLLFAAVFAFFSIKSIEIIVKNANYKSNVICILLMFILIYSNSIFNINGVRFWTAAWMATFAVLKILIENKKNYVVLLLTTPLIHGAYWLFIAFVIVAYFVKFKIKILVIIFWVSFLFSELVVNNLSYFSYDWMPWFAQHYIYVYTQSNGALEKISGEYYENAPLYSTILTHLPHFFERVLITVLALNSSKFSKDSMKLIMFILVYLILLHFTSAIPSVGRFYFPATVFVVYIWMRERTVLTEYQYLIKLIPLIYLHGTYQLIRFILTTNGFFIFSPAPYLGFL